MRRLLEVDLQLVPFTGSRSPSMSGILCRTEKIPHRTSSSCPEGARAIEISSEMGRIEVGEMMADVGMG